MHYPVKFKIKLFSEYKTIFVEKFVTCRVSSRTGFCPKKDTVCQVWEQMLRSTFSFLKSKLWDIVNFQYKSLVHSLTFCKFHEIMSLLSFRNKYGFCTAEYGNNHQFKPKINKLSLLSNITNVSYQISFLECF